MEYYSAIFPTLTLLELNYRYCPHGNFLHLKIHHSIFLALCTAMPYTQQTLKRTEGGKHQKEKSCRKFSGRLMEVSPLSSCPQQNVSGARVEKSRHQHSIVLMCSHACSVAQSCPTLCNPMDYGPPGSFVMAFPRQEHWRRLPFPSPGDLPNPGIELTSPALTGVFFYHWTTWEAPLC